MAATLRLRLEGASELGRALRKLPAATGGSILQGAVRAGADLLSKEIVARASGAFTSRSGRLARFAGRIREVEQTAATAVIEVGPRVPYAHLVERGHRIIARGSNRRTVRGERNPSGRRARGGVIRGSGQVGGTVAARPFIQPAFEQTKQRIVDRILGVLKKSIEETMALRSFGARTSRGR